MFDGPRRQTTFFLKLKTAHCIKSNDKSRILVTKETSMATNYTNKIKCEFTSVFVFVYGRCREIANFEI